MSRDDEDGWRLARRSMGFCAVAFVVGVLDRAGMTPCGWSVLGLLGVLVLAAGLVVTWPFRWRRAWRSTAFAILACISVLPAIRWAAPYAIRARFVANASAYESVAASVRVGAHDESLVSEERHLGFWVRAERFVDGRPDGLAPAPSRHGPISVVHFMVISHGFAGHVGFARAFDPAADAWLRRGRGIGIWRYSEPIRDGWFLVAE